MFSLCLYWEVQNPFEIVILNLSITSSGTTLFKITSFFARLVNLFCQTFIAFGNG